MDRERTETDQRANAVRIAAAGKKALRGARTASERVERALLASLPVGDRPKFLKMLATVASQAEGSQQSSSRSAGRARRTR